MLEEVEGVEYLHARGKKFQDMTFKGCCGAVLEHKHCRTGCGGREERSRSSFATHRLSWPSENQSYSSRRKGIKEMLDQSARHDASRRLGVELPWNEKARQSSRDLS